MVLVMMVSVCLGDYYIVIDTCGEVLVVILGINLVVFCELTKNIYGFFLCFTTLILCVRLNIDCKVLIDVPLSDALNV